VFPLVSSQPFIVARSVLISVMKRLTRLFDIPDNISIVVIIARRLVGAEDWSSSNTAPQSLSSTSKSLPDDEDSSSSSIAQDYFA